MMIKLRRQGCRMFNSGRSRGVNVHPLPLLMITIFHLMLGVVNRGGQAAFLFPDMALHAFHRSGGSSSYVIAVLQEEPYLYANGTGFVPDLMRSLAERYANIKNGTITFNYEIVPVTTWDDLLNRASSEHVQIAFGLVCPYILRRDEKFLGMHASMSVVHTSVKLITGTPPTPHWSTTSSQAPPIKKLPSLVNVRGSPEDRLLESKRRWGGANGNRKPRPSHHHNHKQQLLQEQQQSQLPNEDKQQQQQLPESGGFQHRQQLKQHPQLHENQQNMEENAESHHQQLQQLRQQPLQLKELLQQQQQQGEGEQLHYELDTFASALDYIRHHSTDVLITDASVADCVVSHEMAYGLRSVCPSRRLSHSNHLFYGFFGRNASLLKFLNDLLKVTQRSGELEALGLKYFSTVRQCD